MNCHIIISLIMLTFVSFRTEPAVTAQVCMPPKRAKATAAVLHGAAPGVSARSKAHVVEIQADDVEASEPSQSDLQVLPKVRQFI